MTLDAPARRALMKRSGLDWPTLAARVGATQQAVRKAIAGHGVPFVNRRLAAVFQMSEYDLFGTEAPDVPIITDSRWAQLGDANE